MISAAEARRLNRHIWTIQLEQIERGIKETIAQGGIQIGYKTDTLDECTVEWLKILGYKVEDDGYNWTKISWEE